MSSTPFKTAEDEAHDRLLQDQQARSQQSSHRDEPAQNPGRSRQPPLSPAQLLASESFCLAPGLPSPPPSVACLRLARSPPPREGRRVAPGPLQSSARPGLPPWSPVGGKRPDGRLAALPARHAPGRRRARAPSLARLTPSSLVLPSSCPRRTRDADNPRLSLRPHSLPDPRLLWSVHQCVLTSTSRRGSDRPSLLLRPARRPLYGRARPTAARAGGREGACERPPSSG